MKNRITNKFIVTIAVICGTQAATVRAQPEESEPGPLPHSQRTWDDELFRARVQGMYDWPGSGPGQLSYLDYRIEDAGMPVLMSIPLYNVSTANRDNSTFPPRLIDREAQPNEAPKDWADRVALISRLRENSEGAVEFFADRLLEQPDLPEWDQPNADTWFLMGNLLFLESRYGEAAENYWLTIEQFSNFRLAYRNLAYAEFILGNYREALSAADMAVELGAMTPFIKGVQAYSALQENRVNTAVEAIAIARMLEPDNAVWQRLNHEAMLRAGREKQLVKQFSLAGDSDQWLATRLDASVQHHRKQGQNGALHTILEIKRRAGLATTTELIELNSLQETQGEDAQSHVRKELSEANDLIAGGNFKAALAAVEELLRRSPTSCMGLMLSAELHNKLEQFAEADSVMHRIELLASSCYRETLSRRAQLYLDREDWERALQLYQLDQQQKAIAGQNIAPHYQTLLRHLTALVRVTGTRNEDGALQ